MKEDLYSLSLSDAGRVECFTPGHHGFLTFPEEETADLGLIFDEAYRGRGLKIAEILKRGPADRRGLSIKAGEFVLNIDGVELTETTDLSQLLNGKIGETVALQVASDTETPDQGSPPRRNPRRQPGRLSPLMYDRWVEHNARRVAELSKGKLGYIHIPSMDEAGLDRFLRSLYSDNFDKEAIVLDVRFNGGGFTHDQILNYLGSREHTIFKQRNGGRVWSCVPTTANGTSRWSCSSTIALTATPRSSPMLSAPWAWANWSANRPADSSSAPARCS